MDIEDIEISSSEDFTSLDPDQYEVKPGDTLKSIAMKFDISESWLRKSNGLWNNFVVSGDCLKITPEPIEDIQCDPITAGLYDPLQNHLDIPGRLFLIGNCLRFEANDKSKTPININLLGHMESAVMPHPTAVITANNQDLDSETMPSIFMITYLDDAYDDKTMKVIQFSGAKVELEHFHRIAEKRSLVLQKEKSYIAPDPNTISYATIRSVPRKVIPITPPPTTVSMKRRPRTMSSLPEIEVVGTSKILQNAEFARIRASIPFRFRSRTWKLVHQLSTDGTSYVKFYSNVERCQPLVFLVKTTSGEKIGAYATSGLKKSAKYYGNGETFVFSFSPEYHEYPWKPSNANQYFISSSNDELSFGGGGGSAIWINRYFTKGASDACPTYKSPQLTTTNQFGVADIEVWGIGF